MVWMYYALFKNLLVGGHLGGRQFGAMMTKVLGHLCTNYLDRHNFSFLWDKCPRLSLLGHMVIAFLVLWETAKLFFRLAVPLSIPTSNVNDLATPYSQKHLVLSLFFILAILRLCSDSSLQSLFLLPVLLWCQHTELCK